MRCTRVELDLQRSGSHLNSSIASAWVAQPGPWRHSGGAGLLTSS